MTEENEQANIAAPTAKPARVERPARLPRLFLWLVAIAIILVIVAAFAWRLAGNRLLSAALVPGGAFEAAAAGTAYDYGDPASWAAQPGGLKDGADDPTAFLPEGAPAMAKGDVPVFFIPPTAAFGNSQWNGRSSDKATALRLAGFLRTEASALAAAGPLWAPHYRQAVLGSFLANTPGTRANAQAAQQLAYADVKAAFARFLAAQPPGGPIILAGHSQGALHLLRLLKEEVAGTPLAARVVAAYAVGWPVSVSADLAELKAWVAKERLVGLVIGLPLNMGGTDSSRTQSVRAFARNVAVLGLPLLLWDERWSTAAVERAMIAEDLSRARRSERVDRLAASYILQGAIDALARWRV